MQSTEIHVTNSSRATYCRNIFTSVTARPMKRVEKLRTNLLAGINFKMWIKTIWKCLLKSSGGGEAGCKSACQEAVFCATREINATSLMLCDNAMHVKRWKN